MGRILNLTELERQILLLVLGEHKARQQDGTTSISLPISTIWKLTEKLTKLTPTPTKVKLGE